MQIILAMNEVQLNLHISQGSAATDLMRGGNIYQGRPKRHPRPGDAKCVILDKNKEVEGGGGKV